MRALFIAAHLLAASVLPSAAETPAKAGPHVMQSFARATPDGATTGAAYLILQAAPGSADELVGVATPRADRAELHSHTMAGDVMQMRRVDSLEIPPGDVLVLEPHGNHIMLLGLKAPLKAGDKVHLTLKFKRADPVEVDVPVIALGAPTPQPEGVSH